MSSDYGRTLFDKLKDLSNQYSSRNIKNHDEKLLTSVFDVVKCYFNSRRGSCAIDPEYGVMGVSYMYEIINTNEQHDYYNSLIKGIMDNDRRVQTVTINERTYNHPSNGVVTYLEIICFIKPELIQSRASELNLGMAYDLSGALYRIKI
jgi:hypothetical protein